MRWIFKENRMKKLIVIFMVIIMIIVNGVVFDVLGSNGHSEQVQSIDGGAAHE